MITTVTNDKCFEFRGLSADTKPTNWNGIPVGNGSIFFVIDTAEVYMFNATGQVWVLLG